MKTVTKASIFFSFQLEDSPFLSLPALRRKLFASSFPRHGSLAKGPLALSPAQLSPSL